MRASMSLVVGLWAGLAFVGIAGAEPMADRGYIIGCAEEEGPPACLIVSRGFNLLVTEEGGTPPEVFATLRGMERLAALSFEGVLGEMGDSSAEIVLSSVTAEPDDMYQGNLQAMQGRWQPQGEETPFYIEINGMDWTEVVQDEVGDSFMMSVGEACGNGIVPGNGMAITLYRYGDDPEDDACWRMEYVDDSTLELRDFKGDQGQVIFDRLP